MIAAPPSARHVTRNIAWSALSGVGAQSIAMIVFLITSRLLSKESFGVVAVCLLTVELIKRLTLDTVVTSMTSDPDVTDEKFSACFVLNISLGIAGAILSIACSPFLAWLTNSPKVTEVMPVCGLLLVFLGVSRTYDAWFSRHLQFRMLAARSFFSVVLGGAAGILCALSGLELWSLIVQQFVNLLTSIVLLAWTCGWRPHLPPARSVTHLFKRSMSISSSVIWSFVAAETDVYCSSYLLGPITTGVYSASKRLVLAANLSITHPLASVVSPAFASTGDPMRRRDLFLRGMSLVTLVTAPAFVGLAIVADDFVLVALGEKWRDVGPILTAMSVNGYVFSLAQFATAIFFSSNKTYLETRFNASQAILCILLLGVFGVYGGVAIALCVLASSLTILPFRLRWAGKLLGARPVELMRSVSSCIAPTIFMSLAAWGTMYEFAAQPAWLRLLVCVAVSVVSYLGVALVTSRQVAKDIIAAVLPGRIRLRA